MLGCGFIWFNSSGNDFDFFVEVGRIQNHIIELTEKSSKKPLIDNLLERLLKLGLKKLTQ